MTIYSVTRSNPEDRLGFLRDASRLNVALSRSKQYLALVGTTNFSVTLPERIRSRR